MAVGVELSELQYRWASLTPTFEDVHDVEW